MSPGLSFIAGFVMGGITVFVVTAVSVWRPVLWEYKARFEQERDRRIAAEDQAQAQLDDDVRIIGEFPPIVEWIPWSGEGEPFEDS